MKRKKKECPICKSKIYQLNPRHIKNCFGNDSDYKYKYIIHNFPQLTKDTLYDLYVNKKWSMNMIHDKYLIDLKSIYYLIKYYEFNVRSISESHKLKEYKNRIESTNLKRFGAKNPLSKGTEPYKKRNKTVRDKYGCDNVFQILGEFIDDWKSYKSGSSISSLNKRLYSILDDLNLDFKAEYSIKYLGEDGKKRYKLYDAKIANNILIEVNGDYWHANPNKYNESDVFNFPKNTLTAKDIWKLDLFKKEIAELNGYDVLYIWESEFNNIENVKQKIKDKINKKNKSIQM